MKLEDIRQKLLEQKKYVHLFALDSTGYCMKGELPNHLVQKILINVNKKIENMCIALDEWRMDNEDQFNEDSEDFNDWVGDTLEIQEMLQDTDILMKDLVE